MYLLIMLGLFIAVCKLGLGVAIKGLIFLWVLRWIFRMAR